MGKMSGKSKKPSKSKGSDKMNTFQPWQDTIPLLAGQQSARSTRPGEQFATAENHRNEKRVPKYLMTYAARLLMVLRITQA